MAAKTSVENFAMTESGMMEMEKFLQSVSLGNIVIPDLRIFCFHKPVDRNIYINIYYI